KAPRHQGLWFAFGHAHHGLTLGQVTGRVLAEVIPGVTPFIDIAAYSPQRFTP
ncbi:amino acid dehydrogenase, partial [Rhizobium ruizarguesonis]